VSAFTVVSAGAASAGAVVSAVESALVVPSVLLPPQAAKANTTQAAKAKVIFFILFVFPI
jgi:hypothetical protein